LQAYLQPYENDMPLHDENEKFLYEMKPKKGKKKWKDQATCAYF